MKKLFEKPVMDVLFFDEEDIISVSSLSETSSDVETNAERAAEGLNTSIVTVEKASSIIDK